MLSSWARSGAVVLGLAVSALFAYLAVRHVDWASFRRALSESDWWWLAPALVVLVLGVLVRAARWRLLFPREWRPPLPPIVRAVLVGMFFNNVLPGRPGEAIRVATLYQETRTSRGVALATAVTERLYDVVVLLVLLFGSLPFLPESTSLRRGGIIAAAAAVVLVVLLIATIRSEGRLLLRVLRPFERLPGVSADHVEQTAQQLLVGLQSVKRTSSAVPVFVLSIGAMAIITASYWLVMPAFHLHLGFDAALLVMVATNLAMLIPASPASIGVFEAAVVVALRPYGVDRADALSYGVVLHVVNTLPFIVAGGILVPHHGIRALRRQAES
jgi:uncharacterized protein (TIRG00374 family)